MLFLDNVIKIMRENKITRQQLLADLGLGKNQFTNWNKGTAVLNNATKIAIANYLGVTVDYLEGRTEKENDPAEARSQVEKDVEEIMSLLAAMPEEKREAAKAEIVNYLKVKGLV